MVVVSPQCPTGDNWEYGEMVEKLSRLTDEVIQAHQAGATRVYLTGFSMGGDGVWALGVAHPEQFTALAPVGSWYRDTERVCDLREVPVWVFQGEADEIVRPIYAKDMVAALTACGGQVDLTLLPGVGHEGSSLLAYRADELYDWLAAQVTR
jgi:predicted peptidase